MKGSINSINISGFKSIKELKNFQFKDLNIIIGANGAGKSNFIEVFRMLMAMAGKRFSKYILEHGGADSFLFQGPKITSEIFMEFEFNSRSENSEGSNYYKAILTPTVEETFLIEEERKYFNSNWKSYGNASNESRISEKKHELSSDGRWNGIGYFVYDSISNWMVYHFHDTGSSAAMRRSEIIEDNFRLRENASNIAPLLFSLKNNEVYYSNYNDIVNAIRLVIPFFDDFRLDVNKNGDSEKVRLSWSQKGSDYPMQAYHLSDGSIRFICLATALLQPEPPSLIIIDEPELGLHPEAIFILAELIEIASKRTQVIISTQSPSLIDQFDIENIIVAGRDNGATVLNRLKAEEYNHWLESYSVGELWSKNVIKGGPCYE